jgi:hypothetical protein
MIASIEVEASAKEDVAAKSAAGAGPGAVCAAHNLPFSFARPRETFLIFRALAGGFRLVSLTQRSDRRSFCGP